MRVGSRQQASLEILDRVINKVVETIGSLFSFRVLNSSISVCQDSVEVADSGGLRVHLAFSIILCGGAVSQKGFYYVAV